MTINESKIIDAVVGMNPHGNEEGIIDAFTVYLTNHYADYYNKISYKFEKALEAHGKDTANMAKPLLIEAGHVCGFNTFRGIHESDAWKGLIAPMCKNKEDEIIGLTATLNALGWGVWKVISVTPKKLVIRSKNTYESIGFMKEFGKSKHSECYLATGVAASFMNIIFQKDVYEDVNANAFSAKETKCRSKEDKYCEFVVTRKK